METLHTLRVLFFASISCTSRVLIFSNGKFLKISSFQISAPKKKAAELRHIQLFLSRWTEKQAGHDLYWFIIDFSWINFVYIFFVYFAKYEFYASLACIYFCDCRLFLFILRVFNFAKSTEAKPDINKVKRGMAVIFDVQNSWNYWKK